MRRGDRRGDCSTTGHAARRAPTQPYGPQPPPQENRQLVGSTPMSRKARHQVQTCGRARDCRPEPFTTQDRSLM